MGGSCCSSQSDTREGIQTQHHKELVQLISYKNVSEIQNLQICQDKSTNPLLDKNPTIVIINEYSQKSLCYEDFTVHQVGMSLKDEEEKDKSSLIQKVSKQKTNQILENKIDEDKSEEDKIEEDFGKDKIERKNHTDDIDTHQKKDLKLIVVKDDDIDPEPNISISIKEIQIIVDKVDISPPSLPLNKESFQRDMFSPNSQSQIGSKSHKSKSIKIGVDIFVNLKQGSILKYYTTGQVLGQGAFGKVWKVTHKTTGIVRAMKQLKKSSLINEEEQKLFAEMNILKNLDHPHIVKLYELYQDQGNYYLITEFLCGGELFDRIKKMNNFSERKAADLMRQILLAIVYCHEQNIVHRDLKPENIIFTTDQPNSNLKVIDFGTSRKFTTKSMTKQLGTPYYIAPEVLNQNYNEKCDVWSCGVILFILLCGYPPFTGRTEKDIMAKVKLGKFTFQNDDWSMISNEAKSLINQMLNLDPKNRISAKQALNDSWIQKHAPNHPINKKALLNLSQFQAKSVFKQALMSYIVCQMSTQQETDELQKTFQSLDQNNDGYLSKEELIQGYILLLNDRLKAEQEVNRILELIDLNHSGKVDFSEFLLAAMNQENITSIKKIDQAFKIFDQDGDGFISKQEMEQVMGEFDDEQWNQFLSEVDLNHDGKISQAEFKKILQIK